jgi:MFS family permease
MLWLAWAPMAAAGLLQYGYGALVPVLVQRNDWTLAGAFWLLAVWAVFQAGVGLPTAYLRERGRLGPRPVMVAGALLCMVGLVSLAHSSGMLGALLGYSVLGGVGAGLIYATCTSMVGKWYPERMASRVSFVTGAFAYGSVPFVVALVLGVDASNLAAVLDVVAALLCLVVAGCGLLFVDPPVRWWPPHIDPRDWALRAGRGRTPPAMRQYSAQQALRTRTLPVMYLVLLCAGAVSLFNAAFLVTFAAGLGFAPAVVALAAAWLLGINGTGRAIVVGVADRFGLCRTLGLVLVLLAIAQFWFVAVANSGSAAMLQVAAALAGLGGGAFYPLFARMAREYFGEQSSIEVHALVYSAKAFGGLVGVGLVVLAVSEWGYPAVFLVSGCVALVSAGLSQTLRRPGLPQTLPSVQPSTRHGTPAQPVAMAGQKDEPEGAWRWCP